MPLGLNTADKAAVRGQNNSKAPYNFAVQHYYIFKDKHDTTCTNHSISHRNIILYIHSALVLNCIKPHEIRVEFCKFKNEENLT